MTHTAPIASRIIPGLRSKAASRRALSWLVQCALALVVAFSAGRAWSLEVPPLRAHVNDIAAMLSPAERESLEGQLADYESKTGRQFALLTIDSLDGDALESFSIRVVEAWKLGKKGVDSGLLLLIVKNDRKLRVEVGYGLEGTVTDAFSARVIRNLLVPALRAGKIGPGVEQAFGLLMSQASGEDVAAPEAPADERPPGRNAKPFGWIVLLLFLSPILIPLFFSRGRGGRGPWGGGGWGGGGFGGGGFGGGGFGGGGFGGGGGGGGFSGGGGGFGGGGSSGSW